MEQYDFAVVGAGVAGCLIASQLIDRGQSVVLFDDNNNPGSSHIAAGSINPITGRKFVKSWKIDLLLDHAVGMYADVERQLGIKVMHKHQLIRGLKTVGMQNDWSARAHDSDYSNYINNADSVKSINGINDSYIDYAIIENAYRVDFSLLIDGIVNLDNKLIKIINRKIDSSDLIIDGSVVEADGLKFGNIIFAEGAAVRENKLFNYLPFVPAHGERFIIHSPDLNLSNPFNDGKIIIPLGGDRYWVGSNYNWDVKDPIITDAGFQLLKQYLDTTLTVPYEILDHAGHVRPATYNRRPFVGRHPELSNCFILNGLGAKGASLAPYCVDQLLGFVLDGASLDEEIDVGRVNFSDLGVLSR